MQAAFRHVTWSDGLMTFGARSMTENWMGGVVMQGVSMSVHEVNSFDVSEECKQVRQRPNVHQPYKCERRQA